MRLFRITIIIVMKTAQKNYRSFISIMNSGHFIDPLDSQ